MNIIQTMRVQREIELLSKAILLFHDLWQETDPKLMVLTIVAQAIARALSLELKNQDASLKLR